MRKPGVQKRGQYNSGQLDLSATKDCISLNLAEVVGVMIDPNVLVHQLLDMEWEEIEVLGKVLMWVKQLGDVHWITVTTIVCLKLLDPMLLSWRNRNYIGILSKDWPLGDRRREAVGAPNRIRLKK